jgi:c-di-GMP-related signal transduction protein
MDGKQSTEGLVVSFVDVVVAREALYDRDQRVVGYEIMFRHVEDVAGLAPDPNDDLSARRHPKARPARSVMRPRIGLHHHRVAPITLPDAPPSDLITATMLFSSLSVGIDSLVGDRLAFCGADRGLLTGRVPMTLPPHQTVIQIKADVEIDAEVLAGCQRLAADGYRFAVEDFDHCCNQLELLEFLSFAKIDISAAAVDELGPLMQSCWDSGVKLIGCRIETAAQLSICRDLGFDFFQGHALSRPRIVTGRTTETTEMGRLRIASSLIGSEVDLDELEEIVRLEPGLIFQLLHLAAVGTRDGVRREVRTLRDALVLVGARRLQSWIALLMLAQPGVTMKEDMVIALTRARMTELLVVKVSPWLAGLGFTAGMVSAFDLMLGLPATEIVATMSLADDLREAAFGDTSAVGRLVRDVIDHQNNALHSAPRSGLTVRDFDVASVNALTWAVDSTRELNVA